MAEDAKWYVIHTYSGYENKVATNLEKIVENRKMDHLIQEIKIPTETVIERDEKDNKEKVTERKLFPSYVLIKMILSDESWHVVRNIRGVTSFVGPGSKPVPLTDREIAQLNMEPVREISFGVGDSVVFTEGPFENSVGVVEEISSDNKRIKVTLSLFGRQNTIEADSFNVKPIEDKK